MQPSIILVEDDQALQKNIADFFIAKQFEIDTVNTAKDFYHKLEQARHQIAIVDIGLPDASGLTIVEYLRKNTQMGVIVLTANDSMYDKLQGYKLGADYYFTKPTNSHELEAAIYNLVNRFKERYDPKSEDSLWQLNTKKWLLLGPKGYKLKLTNKELLFLSELYRNQGKIISREYLLQKLNYADKGDYGNNSLDTLVARLRKKVKTAIEEEPPILTARNIGYCWCT